MTSKLRRWLPIGWLLLCAVGAAHSIASLAANISQMSWLAALLSCGAVLATFAYLYWHKPPEPAATFAALHGVTALSPVLILLEILNSKPISPWPLIYSVLIGYGGTLLFIRWYAPLRRTPSAAIQPGALLPAFKLISSSGDLVSSTAIASDQQPTIWLFLCGGWNPFCTGQLKQITQDENVLALARIVVITPPCEKQPIWSSNLTQSAELFMDSDEMTAIKTLGIQFCDGTTAGSNLWGYHRNSLYPTTLITNVDGRIVYCQQTDNELQRPRAEELATALKAMQP